MSTPGQPNFGGILRQGAPGSYSYEAIVGREEMPVNWVSFWGAARFANWLHNGMLSGLQDDTTTEDGAYTLTPQAIAANSVIRNLWAVVFIPNDDEWYKAAYYDPVVESYFDYPTASNVPPSCINPPGPAPNSASCDGAIEGSDIVGSYTASPSPNGTFDQAGNVWEWNETTFPVDWRIIRGGGYNGSGATSVKSFFTILRLWEAGPFWGFRVAALALQPAVPSLSPMGIAALLGLLCLVGSGRNLAEISTRKVSSVARPTRSCPATKG